MWVLCTDISPVPQTSTDQPLRDGSVALQNQDSKSTNLALRAFPFQLPFPSCCSLAFILTNFP